MIDSDAYIKQGLKIVKALIAQGNLQGALSGCNELLKINPYNRDIQKNLKKIEELIVASNIKKVDTDIEATMHLWDEKRYQDLLEIYNRLYPFAPSYGRLQKLIGKVQSKLSDQNRKERDEYIDNALKAISDLLRQKQLGDAIQACNELLLIDPLNSHAQKYLTSAQNELIQNKLNDNQKLLESSDLDRISQFYTSLLSIRPDHSDLQKRSLQVKAQLAERKILAEKIHLNESIARMKELFKSAEYEHVLQSAAEIDRLDPGNISARIFKKKAIDTMQAETEAIATKKMKEAWGTLLSEYQRNPGAFIKI